MTIDVSSSCLVWKAAWSSRRFGWFLDVLYMLLRLTEPDPCSPTAGERSQSAVGH